MPRPARDVPVFTEHRLSKLPDLCTLILMNTNNDSNFIGCFAVSLEGSIYWLHPDPSGLTAYVPLGCTLQLEFDAATSIATNGRFPISEGLQAVSGKRKFQPDKRHGCEKYNDSDNDEWFLGSDEKRE